MTPMKCFYIKDLELYTEDMTGRQELVATFPHYDSLYFVVSALRKFHTETPTLFHDPMIPTTAVPFTKSQVIALENYQVSGEHPYTCFRGHGPMIPTTEGWHCNLKTCTYKQDWAHPVHSGVA
jgi:hypothetical protein